LEDIMQPGIHTMTAQEYHAGPCPTPELSNSLIKTLLSKSPLHAWGQHPKLNPGYKPYESDRFDLGTAAHSILLEGEDNIVIVDAEDWRTKAAKEAREAARLGGRTALLTRHYTQAKEMAVLAKEFVAHTHLAGIFDAGMPEATVLWQEGSGGPWCKARTDLLAPGIILDYKTTSASSPADFMRSSMVAFGYDVQDSWYRRGLKAVGQECEFLFLVQEDTAPFSCYLVQSTQSMREMAKHKVERAITIWDNCLFNNNWPAYGTEPYMAQAPAWAMTEEMSRE
jgi:hypothetical protein